jgi:hypothetical protein
MERGMRALIAVAAAALLVALPMVLRVHGPIVRWGPLIAFVVFIAYSAYVWLAHDKHAGHGVPLWEMVLLGGACGLCIGYMLGQTLLAAIAGLMAGLALGLFADKWTGFVKHL